MNEAKAISVVVAASDFYAHTPELFQSLDAQETDDFHIIVVDDGSIEGCELGSYDRAMVLRNMKPLGFSRALNQALSLSMARWEGMDLETAYVLFLQPEIILDTNVLEKLRTYLDEHQDEVAAAPIIYRAHRASGIDEEPDIDFTDDVHEAGFTMTKGRELKRVTKTSELFGPSPDCFMVRADFLKNLSEEGRHMDESLSRFPSLIDLIWRMKLYGGRFAVVEDAAAWRQLPPGAHHKKTKQEKRQEMLITLELHAVHAKLSPNSLRARHAPWLTLSFCKRMLRLLGWPSLWRHGLQNWIARFRVSDERSARLNRTGKRASQMTNWFV